jgi:hypothetical protein
MEAGRAQACLACMWNKKAPATPVPSCMMRIPLRGRYPKRVAGPQMDAQQDLQLKKMQDNSYI